MLAGLVTSCVKSLDNQSEIGYNGNAPKERRGRDPKINNKANRLNHPGVFSPGGDGMCATFSLQAYHKSLLAAQVVWRKRLRVFCLHTEREKEHGQRDKTSTEWVGTPEK